MVTKQWTSTSKEIQTPQHLTLHTSSSRGKGGGYEHGKKKDIYWGGEIRGRRHVSVNKSTLQEALEKERTNGKGRFSKVGEKKRSG